MAPVIARTSVTFFYVLYHNFGMRNYFNDVKVAKNVNVNSKNNVNSNIYSYFNILHFFIF
jgi:hypothetical protein